MRIDAGHQLVLHAPVGFDLLDPYAQPTEEKCRGFQFDPPDATFFGVGTTVKCSNTIRNMMTFNVVGASIQKDTAITFSINVENPATTPYIFDNFWKVGVSI